MLLIVNKSLGHTFPDSPITGVVSDLLLSLSYSFCIPTSLQRIIDLHLWNLHLSRPPGQEGSPRHVSWWQRTMGCRCLTYPCRFYLDTFMLPYGGDDGTSSVLSSRIWVLFSRRVVKGNPARLSLKSIKSLKAWCLLWKVTLLRCWTLSFCQSGRLFVRRSYRSLCM